MNIKAERLNRGLSVSNAAELMQISERVLRYAEAGTRPREATAKLIADFYGVLVTDIWPVEPLPEAAAIEQKEAA